MYNDNDYDKDINYSEGSWSDSNSSSQQNSAYNQQNSAYSQQNSAYSQQNSAYGQQNSSSQQSCPDFSYIPEEPKKSRKKSPLGKRIAGLAAAGLLFGCVAGATMAGVNMAVSRLTATEQTAEALPAQTEEESIAQAAAASAIVSTGNDVSAIVEKAMPSVVAITNKVIYTQQNWFFGEQQYEASGSGSGIIAGRNDSELLIVTNNHVVEDSTELSVTFIDGTSVAAAIKGTDSDSDLAVIAVKLEDIPAETMSQIKEAELGDSEALKLGQGVVAIGNALGMGQSVTVGYVSALNKEVQFSDGSRTLLQVDAAINPGNSGGALLNMQGEVIGINAAKYADTDVEGIGYAIPISFAKDIIDELMTKTTKVAVAEEEQGYLGIQLQNIDSRMAQAYGMPEGIYVYKIVEGGAAANSDLRERDIITKFDGERVKTGEDLQQMLTYYKGGSTVTLTVQSLDNGTYTEREVSITLGFKKDLKNEQ